MAKKTPTFAVAASHGHVFITPDGTAHDMRRLGERRNGVLISTAEMSDSEIRGAGLEGRVRQASVDANRLYGGVDGEEQIKDSR